MNINYVKTKKLANYNNQNYTYCCESLEITSNRKTCNNMEHCTIDDEWQLFLQENGQTKN